MSASVQPVSFRKLGLAGSAFSQLRHIWPHDRFLWPGAEALARLTGLRAGRAPWQTAEGFRMELDPRHYPDGAMLYGTYEIATVRAVRQILRPGDVVVDIGANIGYFSIRFSQLVGPGGSVFSFEPVPTTRARLLRNIAENGCGNVTVCPVALMDRAASVTIFETESHGVAGLRELSENTTAHPVEGVRLDDYLSPPKPVRLIKIDVEGAERLVLQGGEGLIARDRPHIVLEKDAPALKAFGYGFSEVAAQILRHGGYRMSAVDRGTDLTTASPAEIDAARDGNYLFAPIG
ncbi:FkbM family methyltransferase [Roseococcus sp. SYP-B2431]|uniref:FkbM family methyltransferase n=1 Tax=Roseococcus sp. SYP-B2431 TaxID=2496640 RepID=UPI00103FB731|nr:FkbM family methyltransferase [Roseococcus sp. SYP-B2431]TCH99798.1 FkbM family methyltransferase [Roseococcus sp. SYP-B2431]